MAETKESDIFIGYSVRGGEWAAVFRGSPGSRRFFMNRASLERRRANMSGIARDQTDAALAGWPKVAKEATS